MSGGPAMDSLVRKYWVLLRPGEFMTATLNLRGGYGNYSSGTVTYHVEYLPPEVSPKAIPALAADGYFIPTESLATSDESFDIQ